MHIKAYTKVVLEKKKELIFKKVSLSETLKFENVTGNNKRADAKIAGITPAELIFKGK